MIQLAFSFVRAYTSDIVSETDSKAVNQKLVFFGVGEGVRGKASFLGEILPRKSFLGEILPRKSFLGDGLPRRRPS